MESDATEPSEQALTEALLSLSWPLPRTVEDADAALTRLEEVRAVLTRLEQESVGSEAWWAGQVDALSTQSGFVLEWWRPVLRDPELDWTLNHQAHLTADLATLASAGARLLDQMEPRAAEDAAAAHARRAAQERRWGPAAVPPPDVPGARPQPPGVVFGTDAAAAAGLPLAAAAAPSALQGAGSAPQLPQGFAPQDFAPKQQPSTQQPSTPWPSMPQGTGPHGPVPQPPPGVPGTATAGDLEPPQFPPLPSDPRATEPPPPEALNAGAARHRRPSYDFEDPDAPPPGPESGSAPGAIPAAIPVPMPPAVLPQPGLPQPGTPPYGPGSAGVPGQRSAGYAPLGGLAGPPVDYPPPGPGPSRGAGPGPGPGHGYDPGYDEDEDEPGSLVPTALHRHQRRLLLQTGAILAAIGVLCWWAVYTVSSGSGGSHPSADSTHTTGESTAQGGVGAPGPSGTHASATPSPSGPATSKSPQTPTTTAAPAPSTAGSSVPDGTTVSSVQVTLLGGSGQVPQIVALITVHTAGTGPINVTGAYYGAKAGGARVAAATDRWTFSGQTSYQYSVPIANSAYCGTTFDFTLSAGGRSDTGTTSPGC